ncbi:MAG: hypothetical protein PWQ55_2006 [Chloroflexota bacterium]|nr:hypothetical protein [Chloroflexota bacterium]
MAKKKSGKAQTKEPESGRIPWIPKDTGYTAITVLSVALAAWVAWQNVRGGGQLWNGILWGLVLGASIWLVFFGMNYFHSLFNKKNSNKDK